MSISPYANQCSQSNLPNIHIDRGSVIKPCVANPSSQLNLSLDSSRSSWKRLARDFWENGFPYALKYVSTLKVPAQTNIYYTYLIKILKYIALALLYIHRLYLFIYCYFYPYYLRKLDEICEEFAPCRGWNEAVIRAFAWHPQANKCAVAICNDTVHLYVGPKRRRILRHNLQRKIVDLLWKPGSDDVLVVVTQTNLIIWRLADAFPIYTQSESLYLAPGQHVVRRTPLANGVSQTSDATHSSVQDGQRVHVLDEILAPPLISAQFDEMGQHLYVCSPNSSRIAVVNMRVLLDKPSLTNKNERTIKYISRFGQGMTRIRWSPLFTRLAASTTALSLNVFEPFRWSCNKWKQPEDNIQDMVWSRPSGRALLVAYKTEPSLYALPFLDIAQANDVGGNRTLVKVLDLSVKQLDNGDMIGGLVHSLAWDKRGSVLAISFKDNPEYIILYKTVEKPTVDLYQLGVIQSDNASAPLTMDFHNNPQKGVMLTICWSDGACEHVPISSSRLIERQLINGNMKQNGANGSFNRSNNQTLDPTSPGKTARSITSFNLLPGNNSISTLPSLVTPMNKVSHQTTLFTLSNQSRLPNQSHHNDSSTNSFDQ